jgi:hypothetical protein
LIVFVLAPLLAGCGSMSPVPPTISVADIEPSGKPARPPGCDLQVLRVLPSQPYREVAIIEGVASVYAHEKDLLPAIEAKACESGADAMVVKDSKSQTSENMVGYYINAVAIVWGNKNLSNDQTIVK